MMYEDILTFHRRIKEREGVRAFAERNAGKFVTYLWGGKFYKGVIVGYHALNVIIRSKDGVWGRDRQDCFFDTYLVETKDTDRFIYVPLKDVIL